MIIKIKVFFFWEYIIFSLTFEGNFCKYRNHKLIGISFSDLYRQACCILASQVWWETCWQYREFFVYDELFFSMWLSGFSLSLGSLITACLGIYTSLHSPKSSLKVLRCLLHLSFIKFRVFSCFIYSFVASSPPPNSQCYVGLHVSDPESYMFCSVHFFYLFLRYISTVTYSTSCLQMIFSFIECLSYKNLSMVLFRVSIDNSILLIFFVPLKHL